MHVYMCEEVFPKNAIYQLGIYIWNPSFGMVLIVFWKRALHVYLSLDSLAQWLVSVLCMLEKHGLFVVVLGLVALPHWQGQISIQTCTTIIYLSVCLLNIFINLATYLSDVFVWFGLACLNLNLFNGLLTMMDGLAKMVASRSNTFPSWLQLP